MSIAILITQASSPSFCYFFVVSPSFFVTFLLKLVAFYVTFFFVVN
jgi:hypothetical protein